MNRFKNNFEQSFSICEGSSNFFFSPSKQQLYQQLITDFKEKKVLMTLTGESGLGKTFLIEHIINELNGRIWVIKVYLQRISTCSDFFDVIARELDLDLSQQFTLEEKGSRLIWHMRSLPDQSFVILVDQAQSINPEALEKIIDWVVLITAEEDYAPFIRLVFLGLPIVDDLFEMMGLDELDANKVSRNQIKPLEYSEIKDYIHFYLKRVEKNVKVFEKTALEGIAYYSKGSSRVINKLCDLSLLTASLDYHPNVTLDIVHDVADNCLGKQIRPTLAEIKEKVWGGFVGPVLPESEQENVAAFLAELKLAREFEEEPKEKKDLKVFDNSKTVFFPLLKYPQCLNKFKKILSPLAEIELNQKGFFLGVLGGVMVGVATIVMINQTWLHKQNSASSQLQSASQKINSPQPIHKGVKDKSSMGTNVVVQDVVQHRQQQPFPVSQATNDEKKVANQTVDQAENTKSIQSVELTANSENLQTFANQVEANQNIIQLLTKADQQLEKKQLMTPFEDSAWQTYQDILRIDPHNQHALKGIKKIKETYISWAWIEIQKKNFKHGENLFKKALLISKDDKEAASGLDWLYNYHKKQRFQE